MSRVTSKLQVTVPKVIADRYGIRAGDEIAWAEAGDSIRVLPARRAAPAALSKEDRLALFDAAMRRADRRAARSRGEHHAKAREWTRGEHHAKARGWTRGELYEERVGRARPG